MSVKDEQPFADVLVAHLFPGENCRAEKIPEALGTPDFVVWSKKFVFEVKSIVDGEHLGRFSRLNNAQENIRKAIKQNPKYKKLPCAFHISSEFITLSKGKVANRVADRILDALIAGKSEVQIDRYKFRLHKIEGQAEPTVTFGAVGVGFNGSIKALKPKIFDLLNHANTKQLGAFKETHGDFSSAVLMINQFQWGTTREEIIEALALDLPTLLSFKHIDDIWCIDCGPNGPLHPYKLFDYRVRSWLSPWPSPPRNDFEFFGHWMRALFETETARFFDLTKAALQDKSPADAFTDIQIRVRILDFTRWLMKQGRYDDAMWLVERFSDDPSSPQSYSNQENVEVGESESAPLTVRGQLVWAVQQLCFDQTTLPAAHNHTMNLIAEQNLALKYQALIPLTELSYRMGFLDYEQQTKLKEVVIREALSLLKIPACKDRVVYLLWHCPWLPTEKAREIINDYGSDDSVAPLLVMFTLGMNAGFDAEPFSRQLKILLSGESGAKDCRKAVVGQILQHLWYLEEHQDEAEHVVEQLQSYLDIVVDSDFDQEVHWNVNYALECVVMLSPTSIIDWHLRFLDNIISARTADTSIHIFLSVCETAKAAAELDPEQYILLLGKVEKLLLLGMHFGDMSKTLDLAKNLGISAKELAKKVHQIAKVCDSRLADLSY
jgi:hypothetical protein